MIAGDGYPLEEYHLKTKDGYFLTIHRIPGGNGYKINKTQANKTIVYLVHPLTQSSINWVADGQNQSLGEMFFIYKIQFLIYENLRKYFLQTNHCTLNIN